MCWSSVRARVRLRVTEHAGLGGRDPAVRQPELGAQHLHQQAAADGLGAELGTERVVAPEPAVETRARIAPALMLLTVTCTVDEATPVSGVPIAYHVAPKSSEPSSWNAGAVVVIAPMLTTSWVELPQSRVSRTGVVLLSVLGATVRSISWRVLGNGPLD